MFQNLFKTEIVHLTFIQWLNFPLTIASPTFPTVPLLQNTRPFPLSSPLNKYVIWSPSQNTLACTHTHSQSGVLLDTAPEDSKGALKVVVGGTTWAFTAKLALKENVRSERTDGGSLLSLLCSYNCLASIRAVNVCLWFTFSSGRSQKLYSLGFPLWKLWLLVNHCCRVMSRWWEAEQERDERQMGGGSRNGVLTLGGSNKVRKRHHASVCNTSS